MDECQGQHQNNMHHGTQPEDDRHRSEKATQQGRKIIQHPWTGADQQGVCDQQVHEPRDPPGLGVDGLGLLMIALGLWSLLARLRRRLYDWRWLHRFALAMGPAGFVAVIALISIGAVLWFAG